MSINSDFIRTPDENREIEEGFLDFETIGDFLTSVGEAEETEDTSAYNIGKEACEAEYGGSFKSDVSPSDFIDIICRVLGIEKENVYSIDTDRIFCDTPEDEIDSFGVSYGGEYYSPEPYDPYKDVGMSRSDFF